MQARSRFWFTAKNSLQFGYRHVKVDNQLIPNGGTINDASLRADFWFARSFGFSALAQYEKWTFPLLAPGPQQNFSAPKQITYTPEFSRH